MKNLGARFARRSPRASIRFPGRPLGRLLAVATAVVCASTGFIRQTEADPITYQITGSVDFSIIAGINDGDPFHGKFTYDTDTPLIHTDEILDQFGEAVTRWGVYRKGPPNQPLACP